MDKIENTKRFIGTNYIDYIKFLEEKGYIIEKMNINEETEIVTICNLAKNSVGPVIQMRCPSGYKIIIPGRQQLQENAYTLNARIAYQKNVEIMPYTRIRLVKEMPSHGKITLDYVFYKDITPRKYLKNNVHNNRHALTNGGINGDPVKPESELYKFNQGVEIDSEQLFKIEVINPENNIDASYVNFSINVDLLENCKFC
jgi:hypothetical protein